MQEKEIIDIDIDLQDLIPQFLANRKNDMIQLVDLVQKKDLEALGQLAHKVKGAAAGYGFAQLSDYAGQLEQMAKHKETVQLKDVVTSMKDHFDRIEVRFVPMS